MSDDAMTESEVMALTPNDKQRIVCVQIVQNSVLLTNRPSNYTTLHTIAQKVGGKKCVHCSRILLQYYTQISVFCYTKTA